MTKHNFRADVLELIRDELKVPMVRWPGGNYVSSYRWEDGIGAASERRRRPELAWGGEESNAFGTDEYAQTIASHSGLTDSFGGRFIAWSACNDITGYFLSLSNA